MSHCDMCHGEYKMTFFYVSALSINNMPAIFISLK